jgi:hypothetical protein
MLRSLAENSRSIRKIIGGFNLREPLHADGVNLGDPVVEGAPFDLIPNLAIPENAFQGDELPFLESLGELRIWSRSESPTNPWSIEEKAAYQDLSSRRCFWSGGIATQNDGFMTISSGLPAAKTKHMDLLDPLNKPNTRYVKAVRRFNNPSYSVGYETAVFCLSAGEHACNPNHVSH